MNTSKTHGRILYDAFYKSNKTAYSWEESLYKKRWEDAAEALLEHIKPMTPGQAACEAYWKDRIESSGWGKYSTQAKELWESIAVAGHEQIKKLEENNDT